MIDLQRDGAIVTAPHRHLVSQGRSWSLIVLVVVAALLALAPARASAESLCTDTWIGPAEGSWSNAEDWSDDSVPTSTDVACIGAGKTVNITSGTSHADVIQGEGALTIYRSALEIASALEASTIKALDMEEDGELASAGSLRITGSFKASQGTQLDGAGTLVIGSGASGAVENGKYLVVDEHTLVNEGTFTVPAEAALVGRSGATIVNSGTFVANGESIYHGLLSESPGPTPTFVNTGTLEKNEGAGASSVRFVIQNEGTVSATSGTLEFAAGASAWTETEGHWSASGAGTAIAFGPGHFSLGSASLYGHVDITETSSHVTMGRVEGPEAELSVHDGELTVNGPGVSTVKGLTLHGQFSQAAQIDVTGSFSGEESGVLEGSGETVIEHGASASIENGIWFVIQKQTLVNETSLTIPSSGAIIGREGATLVNRGTLTVNSEGEFKGLDAESPSPAPTLRNIGLLRKTEGTGTTYIHFDFENFGAVEEQTGRFNIAHPVVLAESSAQWGANNPSTPGHPEAKCGDPVSCATGNFTETQTDFSIPGRGVGLDLTRTYNSQAAAGGEHGAFGYGWSSSFGDRLAVDRASKVATLHQADGSTVPFTEESGGSFKAAAWTQDTLSGTEATGYTLTLADQLKYKFSGSSGRLESVADRDGNTTTLSYNEAGELTTITDPSSREIKLSYNGEGLVESAEDPMGYTVKYSYEGGNLVSVTQPDSASLRWRFAYDGSHQMTEMIDGRGGKTVNEYSSNQVVQQTDPAGHTLTFEYEPLRTTITNTNTGSVTKELFTSDDEPASITRGYGTASATTESLIYNEAGYVTSVTDGDGHTTTYGYDAAEDRTSMVDADGDETKWTYDSTHDIDTITTPEGETATIKREAHGNPEAIERPAPGGGSQTTKYKYTATGELESVEDPLKHLWEYEYDSHGDRIAEIDPLGDKRTWEYNEDSQEIASVSPRGNAPGAEAAKFTTAIERDAQGRPLKITDPLGHTVKYTYDGNGNIETVVDGNGHATKYTYNGDNEPVEVEQPSKSPTETEYNGAGQIIAQTDADKHTTKYARNAVGEVTEVVDPLGRKTLEEYDGAGNLVKVTDPAKRTTTYTYNPDNRLTEVSYSSGNPSTVKYEYNGDGARTKMEDGTGTTTYAYDQLGRLIESKDGHGATIKYEYDLDDDTTKITYPNGKAVTRSFDADGRLEGVTDWNGNAIGFSYDPDSDLVKTTFPAESKDEDTYAYDDADQLDEVKMSRASETLASLKYSRDGDGQVDATTSAGLPGSESTEATYDEDNRLIKSGSTEYEYDAANNPTKIGAGTATYDEGDELEEDAGTTYAYDELGERTKATPASGPATTYGYDQAGDMISVERPKEGELAKIEDGYAYDGDGLRTSETISGTTNYLAWDESEALPLLLDDGTGSFVYGPGGVAVEQINNTTGAVTYLHHDQSGSTRLLTGSTGTVTGKCSYSAYGTPTCEGAATTPLGFDGEYTSSDTGLIYMRARVYDPATAQFLTVDPLDAITHAPYSYAGDNPVNYSDPTGLIFGIPGTPSWEEAGEAIAGWGDTITFGGTKWVREQIGDENVDTCSGAYQAGGYGGLVTAVLIPGDGEAEVGADGARIAESAAEHIFRDAEGHLAEDTPENRALIESVVKPENYVRTGGEGDVLYRETLSNGTQAWAKVFNGAITNGGLNQVPFP